MFTQCPGCETIFEISASDLGSAAGLVRCSCCHETFNALETLSEGPPGDTRPHRIPLEMADGGPFGADSQRDADPDGAGDRGEGDRELTRTAYALPIVSEPREATPASDDAGGGIEADPQASADGTTEPPEHDADRQTARPAEPPGADDHVRDEPPDTHATTGETAAVEDQPGLERERSADAPADEDLASKPDVRDGTTSGIADEFVTRDDALAAPKPGADIDELRRYLGPARPSAWRRAGWTLVALTLVVALGAQMIHHWRGTIVRHPTLGPRLETLYAMAGLPLDPNYDVTVYQFVEDPEVQLDSTVSPGRLQVVATVANNGQRAQPHPWLRLTLKDRWGGALGQRSFAPEEYLEQAQTTLPLLGPERLARVNFLVVEPQGELSGFKLDFCLSDASGLTRCR